MSEALQENADRMLGSYNRAPVPEPVAVTADPDFDAQFAREYQTAAKALGYAPPAEFTSRAFRAYCVECGIPLYDRRAVSAYLDRLYGGARREVPVRRSAINLFDEMMARSLYSAAIMPRPFIDTTTVGTWGWRPVRQAKAAFLPSAPPPATSNQFISTGRSYTKPVPIPVLLRAKDLATAFPSAQFFISDEISEADMPAIRDPFLAVFVGDELFIVDKWDEPGFRG